MLQYMYNITIHVQYVHVQRYNTSTIKLCTICTCMSNSRTTDDAKNIKYEVKYIRILSGGGASRNQ